MTRYTFRAETEDVVTEKSLEAVTWDELMDEFVFFLRGCGFYIEDGEFVENTKVSEETADNILDGGL